MSVVFDKRSLIINGKREILISGAVHYPRSTPAMWPKILRESKKAGLNCIETYVFWEGHEPKEGCYNFSGRYDLGRFLDLCHEAGLYVILRIGPYICAEWNFGGLPWWLIQQKDLVSRTYNRPFMAAMERWVRVLLQQIGDRQITHGGPIILAQMENEYNNVSQRYGDEGQRYLAWAGELGKSAGLTVPLVMCYGASDDVIETLNGFSVWKDAEKLAAARPSQPLIWTENWPGWYRVWGQPRRVRQSEEIAYEVMRFFAVGGTGVNYYMWYGGTNFGRDAMYLQTTSYEFGSPIDEYTLPTTKSVHLQELHAFLRKHASFFLEGERLPHQQLVMGHDENDNDGVTLYPFHRQGHELMIVTNATRDEQQVTVAGLTLCVAARSALALARPTDKSFQVVYRSAELPTVQTKRYMIPLNKALNWQMIPEPMVGHGADERRRFTPVTLPHNMLLDTEDSTDFGWYRTIVDCDTACTSRLTARVADFLAVWVNGKYVGVTPETLKEDRPSENDFAVEMDILLQAGRNELLLQVTALGMIKGDWMIDAPMSEEKKGVLSPVKLAGCDMTNDWQFSAGTWGERVKLFDPDVAPLAAWQDVSEVGTPLRWYRGTVQLDKELTDNAPWALYIGKLFKGTIWVNGLCLGRYWQQPSPAEPFDFPFSDGRITHDGYGEPPQEYYLIPNDWLHQGENTLIILEERGKKPTDVCLVRRK
ncbi:MAG TPA: beta-galactosidase [Armatimonadota bacterium]|nr:beta-galactosidase [Armatimonadota bacterium]